MGHRMRSRTRAFIAGQRAQAAEEQRAARRAAEGEPPRCPKSPDRRHYGLGTGRGQHRRVSCLYCGTTDFHVDPTRLVEG